MDTSTHTMTRYLLGELPEEEQTALEEEYFRDPLVFELVAKAETALVDDYVRGRLPDETHQRFEQFYMADPRRRERVKFAQALAATLDRSGPAAVAARGTQLSGSSWKTWLDLVRTSRLAPVVAVALLLIVAAGAWLVVDYQQSQRAAAQAEAARIDAERRARETREVPPPSTPTVSPRPAASVVALALVVGPGERSVGTAAPTLVIPPDTQGVRFDLALREHSYDRYRVLLRQIGGDEILRRGDLTTAGASPAFALTLPSSQLPTGDYMLTFQGAARTGDYEDLSQSIFRIERK